MSTHDGWPARTADTAGPDTAGPDTAGPDTAGPETAAPDTAAPEVARGPVLTAPATGDAAIDAVLGELDAATDQPLARHIEAGERVDEVLRERLSDLGGA